MLIRVVAGQAKHISTLQGPLRSDLLVELFIQIANPKCKISLPPDTAEICGNLTPPVSQCSSVVQTNMNKLNIVSYDRCLG